MPITFAVKIVWLKAYMDLDLQSRSQRVSNLTTFQLAISRTIFKLLHSNLAWQQIYGCHNICSCLFRCSWFWYKVTVDRQRQQNQCWMLSATKQAISIKLATTVGRFLHDLVHDPANISMGWPTCMLLWLLYYVAGSNASVASPDAADFGTNFGVGVRKTAWTGALSLAVSIGHTSVLHLCEMVTETPGLHTDGWWVESVYLSGMKLR